MTLNILNLFLGLATLVVGAEHAVDSSLDNDEVCEADACSLNLKQLRAVQGHVPIDMNNEQSAPAATSDQPTSLIEQGPDAIYSMRWPEVSHQVWDSHHCANSGQVMKAQGRREMEELLLTRTSYKISHSGKKGCSSAKMVHGQNFGKYGRFQASMSKECQESWRKEYGRVPQGFHYELQNCRVENQYCDESKEWYSGKSTARGGLDYVCDVLLVYLDHHV